MRHRLQEREGLTGRFDLEVRSVELILDDLVLKVTYEPCLQNGPLMGFDARQCRPS